MIGAICRVRLMAFACWNLGRSLLGRMRLRRWQTLGLRWSSWSRRGARGGRRLGQFAPGESKAFHTLSRGKRGIVVDLRMSRGREVVQRLIADFDVFVTNARPGVPERIGVDYETLRRYRPDLIYCTSRASATPSRSRRGRSTRSGCRRSRSARART